MIGSTDRFQLNDERAVAQMMDGEAVIIDITSGTYYSLDATGGRVWELMEDGATLHAIAAAIAREYAVSEQQVLQDVRALFQQLASEQLIVEAGAGAGDEAEAEAEGAWPDRAETLSVEPAAASDAGLKPYQVPALQVYRDMQDLLALDPPMPGLRDIPWK